MCFGGGASTPPTPAPSPQLAQGDVTAAGDAERRRRRAAASNTVLTSAQGVNPALQDKPKTLLGS